MCSSGNPHFGRHGAQFMVSVFSSRIAAYSQASTVNDTSSIMYTGLEGTSLSFSTSRMKNILSGLYDHLRS